MKRKERKEKLVTLSNLRGIEFRSIRALARSEIVSVGEVVGFVRVTRRK